MERAVFCNHFNGASKSGGRINVDINKSCFIFEVFVGECVSIKILFKPLFLMEIGIDDPFEGIDPHQFGHSMKPRLIDDAAGIKKFKNILLIFAFIGGHLAAEAKVRKTLF